MTEIIHVPLSLGILHTLRDHDGAVNVVFRPAVEALGLSVEAQVRKLNSRSWACTALRAVQLPGDSQVRTHMLVDRKTFTMWLATVNENNVPAEKRPQLIAFQREAAEALDRYFHEGGVINPRATHEQLDEIERRARRAKAQAEVLVTLRQGGVVDPAWLDAQGRHLAAVAMGIAPEVDPATRPLTVGEYLESRGLRGAALRSTSPTFGKTVKALYRRRFAAEPPQVERFVDGALRMVAGYTEAHRELFDEAYRSIQPQHEGAA